MLPAFAVDVSLGFLIKSSASITAVFPSGVVTIAFPLSSTTTTAPGFTASTFALIASFTLVRSSGLNVAIFSTTVWAFGLLISSPPFTFWVSSGVLNKSAAGIVAIVPSLRTTVALPSASYLTVASAPFNFFSFSVAFAWSAGFVALPTTLSAGLRIPALPEPSFPASANVRTNSFAGKPAVCPSGVETVTVPAASIDTTALGLTSRTAFLIFSLSSAVNWSGLLTITLSVGRLILFPPPAVSKALASFVKSTCFNVSVLPFGNVTLALPSWFTVTLAPGFTASIAFLSFSCSSASRFVGFFATNLLPGKRAELIAAIAVSAAFLAWSTLAFFLAPLIASSDAFLISSTSSWSFFLASDDNAVSSWIDCFLASAAFVTAVFASGFFAGSFAKAVIAAAPSVPAVLISPWIVPASSGVSALFFLALISAFLVAAISLALSLTSFFSSSVKSVRASISFSFSFNASSILSNAACLPIGLILPIAVVPSVFPVSTAVCAVVASAGVGAVSGCSLILAIALSASTLAAAFAASFSFWVKSSRSSSASFLAFNASVTACLAFSFATGFTFATASVPSVLAPSTAVLFVASSILPNAAVLSSFTLAIALSFSACDKLALSVIALILLSASVVTASIAGCLSKVTNSDNGLVSFEPSVYVTTRFSLSSFVTEAILASLSVTGASFEMFASSLFWLYSICSFSLILANSSSVTLAGSVTTTFSVGVLISYLSVWDLTMNSTYPGFLRRSS